VYSLIDVMPTHCLSTLDPRRPQRAGRGGKMAEAIALEKVDEDGNLVKRLATRSSQKHRQTPKQHVETTAAEKGASMDEDDEDYEIPELKSGSDSDSDCEPGDTLPSNAEVHCLIPWHFVVSIMTHSFV
jgi:hypothetical protein